MDSRRVISAAAIVLGIVLLVIAVIYWVEPEKSLPSFFPGHANSTAHHFKHGLAAIILAIGCFVFVWFRTGPKQAATPSES